MKYKLSKHEIQSGVDRLEMAEGLILQLPDTHDGRNTWLLNYGISDIAYRMRAIRGLQFDSETMSAKFNNK